MKKLFTIFTILLLSASLSYGATTTTYNAKQQLKQNLNKTKTDFQSAVKSDIENAKKQNTIQTNQKKQEKINQIDQKINQLNKEIESVKADKTITETERTLKLTKLQHQLNYYNKQKEALK